MKNKLIYMVGILSIVFVPLVCADDFVKVNGTYFTLNGTPFYFAGTNAYFLWFSEFACNKANPDAQGKCVTELLNDAKAMNFTVIRTWGFGEGHHADARGHSFQPKPGIYNETTFENFDRVIYEASQRKLKLLVALANNWNDYGGMCQYNEWCGIVGSCSDSGGTHDQFYTNACTKDLYKRYVAYFLNRTNSITGIKYKDDPTIFGWELANEPRARSDTSGDTLYNWIVEMSAYIKSIDSNHLVATGEDGFYVNKDRPEYGHNGYDGGDFINNSKIDTIDYCSFHIYDWSGLDNSLYWIEEHFDDCRAINKPIVAGELGYDRNSADYEAHLKGWYDKLEETGVNGDFLWMLCPTNFVESGGRCVYYPSDDMSRFIINHSNFMKDKNDTHVNTPPTIEPIGTVRVNETDLITIVADASDVDGDVLTYFIDDDRYVKDNDTFRWQTQVGDHGIYYTTVSVKDGGRVNASTSFYVIVGENIACSVPVDNMVISQDIRFCVNIYELPNGVRSSSNGIIIDCRGSILNGDDTGNGIYTTSDEGIIRNCNVRNYNTGIYLHGAKHNIVIGNNLNNNIRYAMYLNWHSDNNTIINNSLSFTNNYVGVQFWNSGNNTMRYNQVRGHDKGIYNNGEGNRFSYNNLYDNGISFYNSLDRYVGAENNWWGTTDRAEIASDIYGCSDGLNCVDFEPYLLCPYPSVSAILNIVLRSGWNLISIPLVLVNDSVAEVLKDVSYSNLFYYDSLWKVPTKINRTFGYWIDADSNDVLNVEGSYCEYSVDAGNEWSLLAYPRLDERDVSSIYDDVSVFMYNGSWYSYVSGRGSNGFDRFVPGFGYWVKKI